VKVILATPDTGLYQGLQEAAPESYAIAHVPDGLDALESIDTGRPDLVIADLDMTEVDGFDILAFLSRNYPYLPVVVLSHRASRVLNVRLREVSNLRVAIHPIAPAQLLKLCEELLDPERVSRREHRLALSAILYLLDVEQRTLRIQVRDPYQGRDGWLEVYAGRLRAAGCDDSSTGQAALLQMLTWETVTLGLSELPESIHSAGLALELTDLVVQGLSYRRRTLLVRRRDQVEQSGEVTEVLAEILGHSQVCGCALIARDGFVLDSAGVLDDDLEQLAAAVGVMVSGAEGVIGALTGSFFEALVLEKAHATTLCAYAGGALLVLVLTPGEHTDVQAGLAGWSSRIAHRLQSEG